MCRGWSAWPWRRPFPLPSRNRPPIAVNVTAQHMRAVMLYHATGRRCVRDPLTGEPSMIALDAVRALALALPETTERPSFGTPAFFVKNKLFGRMREDGELFVLRSGFFERDALI